VLIDLMLQSATPITSSPLPLQLARKLVKTVSAYVCTPLLHILNLSVSMGIVV